jgi:hypothetical protein
MSKATRKNLQNAITEVLSVATGNTVRQGMPVMLSSGDIVECDSDDDVYYGVAYSNEDLAPSDTRPWTATAGERVTVVLRGSPVVIPVRATAAGLTKGSLCAPGSGGVVNVTHGGAVASHIVGQMTESATGAGQLVGCNLAAGCAGGAAA